MQKFKEILREHIDDTVLITKQQSIKFGQWVLTECDVVLDKNEVWTWQYIKDGINYTTEELFEIYLKENDSNN